MFADEARFGRMNRVRPCWAPIGTRPGVAAQLIREYIYLYGAVSPKDGTCVYLIMPTSNTECFQVFLEVLARKFARQQPFGSFRRHSPTPTSHRPNGFGTEISGEGTDTAGWIWPEPHLEGATVGPS